MASRWKVIMRGGELGREIENKDVWRSKKSISAVRIMRFCIIARWSSAKCPMQSIVRNNREGRLGWRWDVAGVATTTGGIMACIRAPRSVRGSIDDIKADSTRNIVQVTLLFHPYVFLLRELSNIYICSCFAKLQVPSSRIYYCYYDF